MFFYFRWAPEGLGKKTSIFGLDMNQLHEIKIWFSYFVRSHVSYRLLFVWMC
jgi:hypothetical protein